MEEDEKELIEKVRKEIMDILEKNGLELQVTIVHQPIVNIVKKKV